MPAANGFAILDWVIFVGLRRGLAKRYHLTIGPKVRPNPYVMSASPNPMMVISAPLFHGLKPVTMVLDAPMMKWASVLIANEAMIALSPLAKKNGTIGMNAPMAVESEADNASRNGFGNDCSDSPSSSLPSVLRAVSGWAIKRDARSSWLHLPAHL